MKVIITIEGGFAKTIFEGSKPAVEWFLKGFQFARKKNLQSAEVLCVLRAFVDDAGNALIADESVDIPNNVHWAYGILSAIDSKVGNKLEVLE